MDSSPGSPPTISPQLVAELAQYAGVDLPADRAAQLAPLLARPVLALRAIRPEGYDDLQPAMVLRVPRSG